MNIPRSVFQALLVLSLFLAACSPVEDPETATIAGGAYIDANEDGKLSDGESAVPEMCVRLYSGGCGGDMIESRNTDEGGAFLFTRLAAGEYCVVSDFEFRTCGYGGNQPTTSISRHVTLESGQHAAIEWFGFSSLAGDE